MTLHYYYSVVVRKLSIAKNKSVNTNAEMAKNWAMPSASLNGKAIGINQYNNLQHLNYAKLDALAMRDRFEKDVRFDN